MGHQVPGGRRHLQGHHRDHLHGRRRVRLGSRGATPTRTPSAAPTASASRPRPAAASSTPPGTPRSRARTATPATTTSTTSTSTTAPSSSARLATRPPPCSLRSRLGRVRLGLVVPLREAGRAAMPVQINKITGGSSTATQLLFSANSSHMSTREAFKDPMSGQWFCSICIRPAAGRRAARRCCQFGEFNGHPPSGPRDNCGPPLGNCPPGPSESPAVLTAPSTSAVTSPQAPTVDGARRK